MSEFEWPIGEDCCRPRQLLPDLRSGRILRSNLFKWLVRGLASAGLLGGLAAMGQGIPEPDLIMYGSIKNVQSTPPSNSFRTASAAGNGPSCSFQREP